MKLKKKHLEKEVKIIRTIKVNDPNFWIHRNLTEIEITLSVLINLEKKSYYWVIKGLYPEGYIEPSLGLVFTQDTAQLDLCVEGETLDGDNLIGRYYCPISLLEINK